MAKRSLDGIKLTTMPQARIQVASNFDYRNWRNDLPDTENPRLGEVPRNSLIVGSRFTD